MGNGVNLSNGVSSDVGMGGLANDMGFTGGLGRGRGGGDLSSGCLARGRSTTVCFQGGGGARDKALCGDGLVRGWGRSRGMAGSFCSTGLVRGRSWGGLVKGGGRSTTNGLGCMGLDRDWGTAVGLFSRMTVDWDTAVCLFSRLTVDWGNAVGLFSRLAVDWDSAGGLFCRLTGGFFNRLTMDWGTAIGLPAGEVIRERWTGALLSAGLAVDWGTAVGGGCGALLITLSLVRPGLLGLCGGASGSGIRGRCGSICLSFEVWLCLARWGQCGPCCCCTHGPSTPDAPGLLPDVGSFLRLTQQPQLVSNGHMQTLTHKAGTRGPCVVWLPFVLQ